MTDAKHHGMRTRRVLDHEMRLDHPPARVFPLLCPTREYDWIEPWDCELLFSRSGYAELDCVFATAFPGDASDTGGPEVWVCSRHEPDARIEFVRVGAHRAMRYEITLAPEGDGTRLRWRQVVTALDAEGDREVAALDETAYAGKMRMLESMLAHYLDTGECLRTGG